MTGFFSKPFGSHNALIIIRPASIDSPPCASAPWMAASRLAHSHATPPSTPLNAPPRMGACANARSVLVPAIVLDQKIKAAKGKLEVWVSLGAPAYKRPGGRRPVTLKPVPAGG